MRRPVPRPERVETLANLLLGPDAGVEPLPPAQAGGLTAALEAALTVALKRTPCVVSFSGGRDSSAILALAADVARRHGLALPVPVTMRFARDEASDETMWQELVLNHVGLQPELLWLNDDLDALGPSSVRFLKSHGVRWPGNAYMHDPIITLARGGTLLTGAGGDELFSTSSRRRSLRQLAFARLPALVKQEISRRRRPLSGYGWLTAEGRDATHQGLLNDELRWPHRWDHALHHWYASRAFAAVDGVLALHAAGQGVDVFNPFLDRQVLAETARAGGRDGFRSRTEAMTSLCGSLLPRSVLSRTTKASFGGIIWGPRTREFAAAWDGTGLDERYVDVHGLRRELTSPTPDFRTVLLLQSAWLHTHSDDDAPMSRGVTSQAPE